MFHLSVPRKPWRRLHRGQSNGTRHARPGSRPTNPGNGFLEIEVRAQRGFHDPIERGVVQSLPPLDLFIAVGLGDGGELFVELRDLFGNPRIRHQGTGHEQYR